MLTNAKAASPGASTSLQPQWKRNHWQTASCLRSSASSQTGVSLTHSVSATAAAPADSGAGGGTAAATGRTVPGDAVASRMARKVDCAASTEAGKSVISVLPPHQRKELDLGGGDLLGL